MGPERTNRRIVNSDQARKLADQVILERQTDNVGFHFSRIPAEISLARQGGNAGSRASTTRGSPA